MKLYHSHVRMLERKDVLLFSMLKQQEVLGQREQCVRFSSPKVLVWRFGEETYWIFSSKRGSCSKRQDWRRQCCGPNRACYPLGKSCSLLPVFGLHGKTQPRSVGLETFWFSTVFNWKYWDWVSRLLCEKWCLALGNVVFHLNYRAYAKQ